MQEIYVIYNKKTGFINGGTGKIDREWDEGHKDGSTKLERIPHVLAKNADRKVIYLPDQDVPDPKKHKIKNGKIVELTEQDKQAIEAAKPKSQIELLKKRITALEAKQI